MIADRRLPTTQQAFAAVSGRCDHEPLRLKRNRWTAAEQQPNDANHDSDVGSE